MKSCKKEIQDYMFHINEELWSKKDNNNKNDILSIVPSDIIINDHVFFNYMKNSNEK